jgi:hypothetical protein
VKVGWLVHDEDHVVEAVGFSPALALKGLALPSALEGRLGFGGFSPIPRHRLLAARCAFVGRRRDCDHANLPFALDPPGALRGPLRGASGKADRQ